MIQFMAKMYLVFAALAIVASAILAAPRCEPGDHSATRIGGAVAIAGCQ